MFEATSPGRRRRSAPREKKGRSPLWARLCVVLGVLMMVTSGGAVVASEVLIGHYDDTIAKENLLGGARKDNQGRTSVSGPVNVLLTGSDYREGIKGAVWRTDTIMVLHIPRTYDRGYLLSFPRDTEVRIPRSKNGKWHGGKDKINAAYAHGGNGPAGFQLLAATLNDLIKVDFNAGAVINFQGFTKMVRVLGGVTLCVEAPTEKSWINKRGTLKSLHPGPGGKPREWKPGCQRMDEHTALDYVRQRKQWSDGDYARIRHQQQFMKAVMNEAMTKGVLTDFGKANNLIKAAGGSLIMDTGGIPIQEWGFAMRNLKPGALSAIRVPTGGEKVGGVWREELRPEAETLFEAIRTEKIDQWIVQNSTFVTAM